jgi:CHAT domain-containing protein
VSDTAAALLLNRLYRQLETSGGQVSLATALRNAQVWLKSLPFDEAEKELERIDRSLAARFVSELKELPRKRSGSTRGFSTALCSCLTV